MLILLLRRRELSTDLTTQQLKWINLWEWCWYIVTSDYSTVIINLTAVESGVWIRPREIVRMLCLEVTNKPIVEEWVRDLR
jgi:hypothetical protein